MAHAPVAYAARHPMILPKDHMVTDLNRQHYHDMFGNSGRERILAEVCEKFWSVQGHATVRWTLRRCLLCKKRRVPLASQQMSDLPKDRVTLGNPPFTKVGVDYFGPLLVKQGRSEPKRYGCLFTCLTTRAIHIEVDHFLDTDSFIQALQRFVACREPQEICSDNGTIFVGACKLSEGLKAWNKEKIHNFLLLRYTKWVFNPPGASYMGGVRERQI